MPKMPFKTQIIGFFGTVYRRIMLQNNAFVGILRGRWNFLRKSERLQVNEPVLVNGTPVPNDRLAIS